MATQLENLKREQERLRHELERQRIKTSEACKE